MHFLYKSSLFEIKFLCSFSMRKQTMDQTLYINDAIDTTHNTRF